MIVGRKSKLSKLGPSGKFGPFELVFITLQSISVKIDRGILDVQEHKSWLRVSKRQEESNQFSIFSKMCWIYLETLRLQGRESTGNGSRVKKDTTIILIGFSLMSMTGDENINIKLSSKHRKAFAVSPGYDLMTMG